MNANVWDVAEHIHTLVRSGQAVDRARLRRLRVRPPTSPQVPDVHAWSNVAGLAVGQDISDRHLQFAAGAQFSWADAATAP